MALTGPRRADVGALYAEHSGRVHRWVLRFYRRGDAEEVVHEIFLKVLERIEGFRNESSPTTWLYRTTVNHCLNRIRNEGRRATLWQDARNAAWMKPVPPADQDTLAFLNQFWRQLDPELIAIGIHYFVDGMTHAEIARVVGCSARTVGNKLERLRAHAHAADRQGTAKLE